MYRVVETALQARAANGGKKARMSELTA